MTERLPVKRRVLRKITADLRPTFVFNRKSLIVLAIAALLASSIGAWRIKNRARHQLEEERARQDLQRLIPFEKKLHHSLASKELEVWQSYKNTRAVARFKDSYFAATDGGLAELDASGNLLRHYSVLDGLPESDLLSLANFNAKLFIGTRTQGLVSFDGERFESYRWTDRASQAVNVLLEDAGRLLIGTMAGGLIEFDGRQFKEISAGGMRLSGINYLSKNNARLYVGTFADGLWVEEGARWSHFTVADGLLSNRIVGVVADGESLFVASDYGVSAAPLSALSLEASQASSQSFRSFAVLPSLASMIEFHSMILLCKDDGESFTLQAGEDSRRLPQLNPLGWNRPARLAASRLIVLDRDLWLLSSDGVHRAQTEAVEATGRRFALSFSPFGQTADASSSLTTNLVSALTTDAQGRLWAGGFRDGIDVFTPSARKLAHLESEAVREINFLAQDREAKHVLAATSQGLLRFDASLQVDGHWRAADGLPGNSVMQVAEMPADGAMEDRAQQQRNPAIIACATSKGLSIGAPGVWRVLTTVQGLPSNSLYTLLFEGRRIYAGTLGGLALVEDGRVVRVFKDTNSNLTHNWVTALSRAGSRLFVGTYGGGVFELTPAGELHGFQAETGRAAVVNPNAMWNDGARLYVGTLDGALVFDLHSQKWTRLASELPSRTVLSVAGDERYTYFGTTNGILRVARDYWDRPE